MPKTKDLTGERFGALTALEATAKRDDRYIVWRCRCDCGKTVYASSKKLARGTIQSCGCSTVGKRSRGKPAEDITGQRFGMLVAVRRMPSEKARTMWLCKCDCGGEKIAEMQALKNGRVKSCGCLKKKSIGAPYKDISGQTFGRLTAIEPTERRDCKGSVYWRCQCACGNETVVTADCLTNGNTVSCGCRKQELMDGIHETLTFVNGTCIDYLKARKSRSDNKSGFRGVFKKGDKYRVSIGFQGKRYYLGTFLDFDEAVSVRKDAEKDLHESYIRVYEWWTDKATNNPAWAVENPLTFDVEVKNKEIYVSSPLFALMEKERKDKLTKIQARSDEKTA